MKILLLIAALLQTAPLLAENHIHHLDLEMTSEEYAKLLVQNSHKLNQADEPGIAQAIKLGTRLSKWIALVNAARAPEQAIRLTSPETRRGIPIDKPSIYNPEIIQTDLNLTLSEMPASMKEIIVSEDELQTTLPLDDTTFIIFARRLDRHYQSAARYKSLNPSRYYYASQARQDVRGFHYLKTQKIGPAELQNIEAYSTEQIALIKKALVQICENGRSLNCQANMEDAFNRSDLAAFYEKHIASAQDNWNSFFRIPSFGKRSDVIWSASEAVVPFNTPEIAKFIPYLQNNIEDEFKFNGWGLKLNFGTFTQGPHLKFQPGVVPHVNRLGGNEIVMDSNQPIEEYESQWTIRHEFGHILGLPDCYHEFYDESLDAFVNYQLDITDLMCSRAGNMNERIYKELEKAYL